MADHDEELAGFFREYSKALDNRDAALFVGAGLSAGAGFPTWQHLLRDIAKELGLDVDLETDLVGLAQFHVNERLGIRSQLSQKLLDEYRQDRPLTPNHRLIARLPIETVWTTNYDQLLERAYKEAGKQYDVKVTEASFTRSVRGKDVTIYKMHGDVDDTDQAVITKDDYERYSLDHPAFIDALRGDLRKKAFLFLGFSFTDPNIDYILSRIRVLLGKDLRIHYCLMREPGPLPKDGKSQAEYEYAKRRLELRVSDLKRYGIKALLIEKYDEITPILDTLNRLAHRNNIFVSGATYEGAAANEQRAENLAREIGKEAIKQNLNIVTGLGLGVGNAVLVGATEIAYQDRKTAPADRILVRPFPQLPQDHPQRAELYTKYRRDMLSLAGYVVYLGGTKRDLVTGQVHNADGVLEEFRIGTELSKYPIPVGATGGAAKEIWEKIIASPTSYFPTNKVIECLQVIGDESRSDTEIITAIFDLINQVHDK